MLGTTQAGMRPLCAMTGQGHLMFLQRLAGLIGVATGLGRFAA